MQAVEAETHGQRHIFPAEDELGAPRRVRFFEELPLFSVMCLVRRVLIG